jgi:hypothetical protein
MTLDAETLDAEKIGCKKDRETIHAKVEVRYGRDYYLPRSSYVLRQPCD